MANKSKKEHILHVASGLFNKQGIRGTGVDQVVAESKIAKMTLYNHFPSKDDLVLAYLTKQDDEWRSWFEASVDSRAQTPKDKLLAMFDALGEWFGEKEFTGCAFIKAASEFGDPAHPYHGAAHGYKLNLRAYIASLSEDFGPADPGALSDSLYLLVEGAIMAAMLQTAARPALHARRAAEILIAHHAPAAV
ncbi:TetR family transcriptional regulator [Saccharibacillus sp. CPCC 101409]|uniref:TetR/AcrR family transcriptional regulator n=1 Tax=Saccharibacillus sp. CPCC 101409 TaxID=3058041 RepID=UPI002673699A|nr:TetR family transcriptional regulator [Saccharibacillus sp. CPCC 101409]MDO3412599.1 TetR family transcriptional regulator [Saccharibacillus sp. CPCC 101409]